MSGSDTRLLFPGVELGGREAPSPGGVRKPEDLAFLSMAQSAARMGHWSWDLTGDTIWRSAELYRVHGVSPGALGHRLEDYLAFIHPEDQARVREAAGAAWTGHTVPVEYRFVHPEGGVRHLLGTSALVRDRTGNAQQLVGTVQDVTEIMSARRSVSDAFTRLSAYFEEMPTPAYLWRREGEDLVLRRFNKAARERWGATSDELTGTSARVLCADRPDVIADIEACLESKSSVTRETDWVSADKGRRRLVVTYVPVGTDSVVAHAEDISELLAVTQREERATARLAEYFQRVPTPAYLWRESDGDILLEAANHAGVKATRGRIVEHIGVSAETLYADRPDVVDDLRRALAGETFTREYGYQSRSLDQQQDLIVTYVHIPPDVVAVHTRDVTAQRRMEAALRESHEAARGVLEACAQPIVLLHVEGNVLALNDAAADYLGAPREQVLGRRIFDFFPPHMVEGRRAAMARVAQERVPVLIEDGHDGRAFEARLYPILDDEGRVSRIVVYAEDVTEEREARDALLRSRERHETAQRIGHLGHWDWAVDRGELFWSREVYRIFGLDPSDELSFETFVACVHPEDRVMVRSAVEQALATGGRYSFEHRVLRPDGTTRIVLEQGEVTREGDLPRTMVGTVLDITDLKEAEEAIRDRESEMATVLEGNPDGICLIIDGCIATCNGSLAAIMRCTRDALIGQRLHDLMVPEDRDRAEARGRAILRGGASEPSEYTLQRRDGGVVPVEIFGAAFEFRGQPALVCTLRDIRKRKEAERELAESRDALRALTQHLESVREEERMQVARDLHDELGSVLTALKIDLAELAAAVPADAAPDRLEGMTGLVDQAIGVGRRVTSRLRPGILDDLGLAAAAEWLGADLERRTGIECRVLLPETEPELSEPVATAMFRILQEALTNVLRHAGADRVKVVVEADDESISLTVSDNGIGFDAGLEGGGFGMLGMRERVRAFDGALDVVSVAGEGTTIRVALPRTA